MKRDNVPFAAKIGAAMMTGNKKLMDRTLCACMQEVSLELLPVINGRHKVDLPFVAAAMTVTANGLRAVMDKDAQSVMDSLIEDTQAIAINMTELAKQMGGGVMEYETT